MSRTIQRLCVVVMVTFAAVDTLAGPPGYTIEHIPLAAYPMHAYDINNNGSVAIKTGDSGNFQGYWWDGTTLTQLPDASGGSLAWPRAINDNEQIVGFISVSWNRLQGAVWDRGVLTEMGWPEGSGGTSAWTINNRGQVAGRIYGSEHAFLWENGEFQDLGMPPGTYAPYVEAINHSGQIVGYATGGTKPRGFLWEDGVFTILDTLGGTQCEPHDINNYGHIVGASDLVPGGQRHPFLYRDGEMIDLGTFGGYYSAAFGLNNADQVVGFSDDLNTRRHAFLWEDGQLYNLDDLIPPNSGWKLDIARAINDAGQIVGEAWHDTMGFRSVVLTPNRAPGAKPAADADGPYAIDEGHPLSLNASGSADADGDIASYMWDLNDDGVYETDAGANALFVVSYEDLAFLGLGVGGEYDIHLKVTDVTARFDTADSQLTIVPEPATLSLLALGGMALVRRRKRGDRK